VAEVDTSARRRAEYSTDASLYRVPPELVAFPRDPDEVVAVVAQPHCHQHAVLGWGGRPRPARPGRRVLLPHHQLAHLAGRRALHLAELLAPPER
jgi:hypothetical protein